MSDKESPDDVSPEVAAMAPAWERVSDLMAGTEAMRQAGKKWLPKAPSESEDAYTYRLGVSTLYGAYRRTVETMAARPFSEPIKLGEDIPAELLPFLDDVTLEGGDLQTFAHGVFLTALAYGLSHILVEFPVAPKGIMTRADEKAVGARPYFSHIHPQNILGWRSERIAGVMTLTMLRLMESKTEPNGVWGTRTVAQVRVLERDRWTTYRKNQKGEWALFEEGPVTIGCIPIATVYTGRSGFLTACPPLLPLAYLNVEHWQSASDQQNILHVARVPILFASGFGADTLTIGAGSAVTNDDPTAKLGYVEHTGAAIDSGRESLLDLEKRMAALGAELLLSDSASAAQTATKTDSDDEQAHSQLAAMVNNLEDSLAQALGYMAQWAKLGPKGGTVELEGDFTSANPLDVQSLVAAHSAGSISSQTLFEEFRRLGLIDEDLTWEQETARLALDRAIATEQATAAATATATAKAGPQGADPASGGGMAPTPAPAAPAPDFAPLLAGIDKLVTACADMQSAMAKPEPMEPAAPMDVAAMADAFAAAIRAIPAPVVNIPAKDDDSALVTAVLAMADAMKNAPAPQITVTAPNVTVEAPAAPTITMPPVNVTIQKSTGEVSFTEGPDGQITGAKLN